MWKNCAKAKSRIYPEQSDSLCAGEEMASSSLPFHSCCCIFASNSIPKPSPTSISLFSSSHSPLSSPKTRFPLLSSNHLCIANPDGILPSELIEEPKFVPLNAEDPRYGPPALLLLGFEAEETVKIRNLLQEMDGEFLKVIHCTEDMIDQPLWEAMHIQQPELGVVKVAKSLPRICFLSGLTGEEMLMFIDAFPETGLEPAVFAALVPNSADKPVREVMEEIMGDHEMMTRQQSPS